jgi:hypothetical protein
MRLKLIRSFPTFPGHNSIQVRTFNHYNNQPLIQLQRHSLPVSNYLNLNTTYQLIRSSMTTMTRASRRDMRSPPSSTLRSHPVIWIQMPLILHSHDGLPLPHQPQRALAWYRLISLNISVSPGARELTRLITLLNHP